MDLLWNELVLVSKQWMEFECQQSLSHEDLNRLFQIEKKLRKLERKLGV